MNETYWKQALGVFERIRELGVPVYVDTPHSKKPPYISVSTSEKGIKVEYKGIKKPSKPYREDYSVFDTGGSRDEKIFELLSQYSWFVWDGEEMRIKLMP